MRKHVGTGISVVFGVWALAGCVFVAPHSAQAAPPETAAPTEAPAAAPTAAPTTAPTDAPTATPTAGPKAAPTVPPTAAPSTAPTTAPTAAPTATPTALPKAAPPPAEAELTVEQVLDNMEAMRETIKTFKADVVKLRQATGLDDSHFTGTIQFKSPRLLKLDLKNTETGAETISYVGKKFGWIYRPLDKPVPQAERIRLADIDKDKKAGNPLEYGLARDMHGLRDGYTLKLLPMEKVGDTATVPLEMTPEGGTTYTNGRLIFWIDTKTWLPVQVREYKSMDEVVETHTFTQITLNDSIRDSTFEFEPPKDVDVLIHDEAPEKARP